MHSYTWFDWGGGGEVTTLDSAMRGYFANETSLLFTGLRVSIPFSCVLTLLNKNVALPSYSRTLPWLHKCLPSVQKLATASSGGTCDFSRCWKRRFVYGSGKILAKCRLGRSDPWITLQFDILLECETATARFVTSTPLHISGNPSKHYVSVVEK